MRNPDGYGIVQYDGALPLRFTPDGPWQKVRAHSGKVELDTFRCVHCGRHGYVAPKVDPADVGGLCKACMGYSCKHCYGKACDRLEEKLARSEQVQMIRSQLDRQEARKSYV